MSDSAHSPPVRKGSPPAVPRAVIHKKILDAAESQPDATIEEIAATTSGASPDLVEHVLEEYGDPAAEDEPGGAESTETEATETGSAEDEPTAGDPVGEHRDDPEDGANAEARAERHPAPDVRLSEKQRTTLRAIYDDPEATQRDLAQRFGVSGATICNRVNDIDGFEWSNRESFVTRMVESGALPEDEQRSNERPIGELADRIDELAGRIERLERRPAGRIRFGVEDPELVHKILHACLRSERITEAEELQIITELTDADAGGA